MQDIAKYFNVHVQTVRNRLRELNIYDETRRNRKHHCDFTFFEDINSEEKAYWLGYIAADGNVYSSKKIQICKQKRKKKDPRGSSASSFFALFENAQGKPC